MTNQRKQTSEAAVREIRRRTRRKFSPEEKIRIVLEGLRGELRPRRPDSTKRVSRKAGAVHTGGRTG